MSVELHLVPGGFSLAGLASLPRQSLEIDWWGRAAPAPVRFVVAESPEALFFGGEVELPPRCDEAFGPGQWVEGLWQRDVLELFARPRDGAPYLEINLAPTGAFWLCFFDGYRARRAAVEPRGAQAIAHRRADRWGAALAIPRAAVAPLAPGGLASCALNVCAILGEPRMFHTEARPAAGLDPDFHRLIAAP